jgi:iron complex outermembrane receptor protein
VVNATYKPIDAVMLYAKYSRGYRAGLVNPRAPAPLDRFGAERVDAYEVGGKASWGGTFPGSFNIAGFYNDFADQQLLVTFLSASGQSTSSICSCGTSTIKGIELDGTISLFAGFELSGAYGYLDTELESFDGQALPGYTIRPNYVVGLPLQYAPTNKWSLTGAYTLPFDRSAGRLTLSATYSHTDEYRTGGSALAVVEDFGLLNLNLNWEGVGGSPIDLAVFGTNVTGKKYFLNANDVSTLGFVNKVIGQPAMYGGRVRVNF